MTEIASPDRAPNGVQSGPSDAVPTEPGSQERGGIHRRGGQHRVRWIALAAIIMAAIITFALAVAKRDQFVPVVRHYSGSPPSLLTPTAA